MILSFSSNSIKISETFLKIQILTHQLIFYSFFKLKLFYIETSVKIKFHPSAPMYGHEFACSKNNFYNNIAYWINLLIFDPLSFDYLKLIHHLTNQNSFLSSERSETLLWRSNSGGVVAGIVVVVVAVKLLKFLTSIDYCCYFVVSYHLLYLH